MDNFEKRFEKQIQLWALLGPFIILLTMAVLVVKFSPNGRLPAIVAAAGLPICWRFKRVGLAISLALLGIAMAISYQHALSWGLYWHVGIGMAFALSLVSSSLALEESDLLIKKSEAESKSRLENLFRLDEQFKEAQKAWSDEGEGFQAQISTLRNKVQDKDEELSIANKLNSALQIELEQVHRKQLILIEELLEPSSWTDDLEKGALSQDKKNKWEKIIEQHQREIADLAAKLGNAELQLDNEFCTKEILAADLEKSRAECEKQRIIHVELERELQSRSAFVDEMNAHLEKIAFEKALLLEQAEKYLEDCRAAQIIYQKLKEEQNAESRLFKQQIAELENEYGALEKALQKQNAVMEELESKSCHWQEETRKVEERLQQKVEEAANLAARLELVQRENETKRNEDARLRKRQDSLPYSNGNTRCIESMYIQLKEQFEEKSRILEKTRKELFHVQEQFSAQQKEWNEKEALQPDPLQMKLVHDLISCDYDRVLAEEEIERLQDLVDFLMLEENLANGMPCSFTG